MNSKFKLVIVLGSLLLLAQMGISSAQTITIDGDLIDWGVDPASGDWTPDIPAVKFVVENWNYDPAYSGPVIGSTADNNDPGTEYCDIEAFYVLDGYQIGDKNYVYFAIITSMPENGVPWGTHKLFQCDLALDLDDDGTYEYGIKLTDGQKCDPGPGGECTVDAPIGAVFHDPVWDKINPSSISQSNWGWANIVGGTQVGVLNPSTNGGKIVYALYSWQETNYNDNRKYNYVIEMKVPKSLLGISSGSGTANLVSAVSCTNDVVKIFQLHYQIPEFPVILIPIGIILGFFYYHRNKQK